jgi:hypothetical protein
MGEYIAFDSHKRYSWMDREDHSTSQRRTHRLEHGPADSGDIRRSRSCQYRLMNREHRIANSCS